LSVTQKLGEKGHFAKVLKKYRLTGILITCEPFLIYYFKFFLNKTHPHEGMNHDSHQ
jgi:hypothetical protein